jgi:tetratricopeptide (TPR) repeat protein
LFFDERGDREAWNDIQKAQKLGYLIEPLFLDLLEEFLKGIPTSGPIKAILEYGGGSRSYLYTILRTAAPQENTKTEVRTQQGIEACYNYLSAKNYQKAIEIGEKLVKIYPENFDAYSCLAQAYLELGEAY